MRGRTNVTQRSGTVPVNGQVKQYEVATGNTIAAGDFVTAITESVETNIASLNSTSSSTTTYSNRLYQREIGEINGRKVYYFYSDNDFSNCLFIIKDTNGDVFSVLNYTPARVGNKLGPACVIGNYIILSDCYDSISNNRGLKVLKLSDDLQTYDIVQNFFQNDYTLGLFGIFKISDSKFVTIYYTNDTLAGFALYSFNNGQITLLQYSANSSIPGSGYNDCYGIASDDGNSMYITFVTSSKKLCCATVKINENTIESSSVSNTGENVTPLTLTKICKLSSNIYFCLCSYDSLKVIMFSISDSGNFVLKSASTLTDLNDSTSSGSSYARNPALTSNGDGSYFVIYIVFNQADLRACKISFLNNSVNIDVKYGELNSNRYKSYYTYLVDKSGDKYFIRYVQRYGNGSGSSTDSSVYFITEMKAKTVGETIDLGGGLKVSSYNGKSIGFAKTGGTAGQTIQVYVPNES